MMTAVQMEACLIIFNKVSKFLEKLHFSFHINSSESHVVMDSAIAFVPMKKQAILRIHDGSFSHTNMCHEITMC